MVHPLIFFFIQHSIVQPMKLTSAEMRTIDHLAESLFTVALSKARRRAIRWPPASYSLDSKHLVILNFILYINDVTMYYAIQNPMISTFLI